MIAIVIRPRKLMDRLFVYTLLLSLVCIRFPFGVKVRKSPLISRLARPLWASEFLICLFICQSDSRHDSYCYPQISASVHQ